MQAATTTPGQALARLGTTREQWGDRDVVRNAIDAGWTPSAQSERIRILQLLSQDAQRLAKFTDGTSSSSQSSPLWPSPSGASPITASLSQLISQPVTGVTSPSLSQLATSAVSTIAHQAAQQAVSALAAKAEPALSTVGLALVPSTILTGQ